MKRVTYKLRVPDSVAECLCHMHPYLKKKVKSALQQIMTEPFSGKELKEELQGLRSFRVSRFRVIYRISGKQEIELVAVGPRKTIYEETYHLIKSTKKQ